MVCCFEVPCYVGDFILAVLCDKHLIFWYGIFKFLNLGIFSWVFMDFLTVGVESRFKIWKSDMRSITH